MRHALGTGVFGQAFHQFAWDGRNDAGQIVPDGVYHVQLQLKDEDRTIEFPSTVRVDSTPPTIEHVSDQAPPLLAGRRPAEPTTSTFSTRSTSLPTRSSTSTARGSRRATARSRSARSSGTAAARSRATTGSRWRRKISRGTSQASTRAFTVRLRYIDLFKQQVHASRPDPPRPGLDRREDGRLAPRPNARKREAAADQASGAVEAGPVHADRDRERPPRAGNRRRPQVAPLTCPGSCRSPHRSNARSPTPPNSSSPQARCWPLPTG